MRLDGCGVAGTCVSRPAGPRGRESLPFPSLKASLERSSPGPYPPNASVPALPLRSEKIIQLARDVTRISAALIGCAYRICLCTAHTLWRPCLSNTAHTHTRIHLHTRTH